MDQDIGNVVSKLVEIYRASSAVPPEPGKRFAPIDIADFTREPPPSRIDCVLDRRSGLDYAAWCIGATLAAVGGRSLMDKVYGVFEQQVGTKGAVWLDHRWCGSGAGWYA